MYVGLCTLASLFSGAKGDTYTEPVFVPSFLFNLALFTFVLGLIGALYIFYFCSKFYKGNPKVAQRNVATQTDDTTTYKQDNYDARRQAWMAQGKPTLIEECRCNGLAVSGAKEELVTRILEHRDSCQTQMQPTVPQLKYVADLERKSGVRAPEGVFRSRSACSAWIDVHR